MPAMRASIRGFAVLGAAMTAGLSIVAGNVKRNTIFRNQFRDRSEYRGSVLPRVLRT
ncbi:Hypothetical protein PFR_JS17-2_82 [Propionibacterium freudenreichii]|nr:Hypothetical protein PFR_JS17-1_82 [Propionibacterium freudenreichii]SCQ75391.1 Hypothetical protein PFR_JS17-2_82 [Propionibacterium freudenreichii]